MTQIGKSTQQPDDDAFELDAYQLRRKRVTDLVQEDAKNQADQPEEGGDDFPAGDRAEEEIRYRDAEQHGKMKADFHAANTGKAQGGGEKFQGKDFRLEWRDDTMGS
jgi:hypothetical protein